MAFILVLKLLLANNVDTDQTPFYVGLHCLPMAILRISR